MDKLGCNVLRKPYSYVECVNMSPSDGIIAIRQGYFFIKVRNTELFYLNSAHKHVFTHFVNKYNIRDICKRDFDLSNKPFWNIIFYQ